MGATMPMQLQPLGQGERSHNKEMVDIWARELEGKDPDTIIRFALSVFGLNGDGGGSAAIRGE